MEDPHCPNYANCQLVTAKIAIDKQLLNNYITQFCCENSDMWKTCKRFVTKSSLGFCPDFVLPDTDMSPDEIMERFDSEQEG